MSHIIDLNAPLVTPPYFTVAEARQVRPLHDEAKYSDEAIDAGRVAAEEALEHACGVAFVPREAAERLDGPGGPDLLVPHPRLQGVTAAAIDGAAVDVAELVAYRDGRVYRPGGWPSGRGTVQVTYVHGFAHVPLRVKRAALLLTKRMLVSSPIDERATEIRTEAGVLTLAGGGMSFDIPEVNATVAAYRYPRVA